MKLQDYKEKRQGMCQKKNLSWKNALEAVKENWYALKYVKNQTENICLEAVKENWYALQYVEEKFFKNEYSIIVNNINKTIKTHLSIEDILKKLESL